MARPHRQDPKDGLHHVMNQGVGKRHVVEDQRDARFLMSKMARVARKGDLEIHSFCIMPNHFHALVRSRRKRLSAALQWIQDGFARYFNRTRDRVGSVFRGRFRSELVTSADYWHTLLWYIDTNPVDAGLVDHPSEYPWGSAAFYDGLKGPPWLTRDLAQRLHYDREEEWAGTLSPERKERVLRLLAMRLTANRERPDPLNQLLHGTSASFQQWIRHRALNADGIRPGIPIVTPGTVMEVIARDLTGPEIPKENQVLAAWALVCACGATREDVGARLGISKTTAQYRLRQFRERLKKDRAWIGRAEEFLRECLSLDHPFAKLSELSLTRLFG